MSDLDKLKEENERLKRELTKSDYEDDTSDDNPEKPSFFDIGGISMVLAAIALALELFFNVKINGFVWIAIAIAIILRIIINKFKN